MLEFGNICLAMMTPTENIEMIMTSFPVCFELHPVWLMFDTKTIKFGSRASWIHGLNEAQTGCEIDEGTGLCLVLWRGDLNLFWGRKAAVPFSLWLMQTLTEETDQPSSAWLMPCAMAPGTPLSQRRLSHWVGASLNHKKKKNYPFCLKVTPHCRWVTVRAIRCVWSSYKVTKEGTAASSVSAHITRRGGEGGRGRDMM